MAMISCNRVKITEAKWKTVPGSDESKFEFLIGNREHHVLWMKVWTNLRFSIKPMLHLHCNWGSYIDPLQLERWIDPVSVKMINIHHLQHVFAPLGRLSSMKEAQPCWLQRCKTKPTQPPAIGGVSTEGGNTSFITILR